VSNISSLSLRFLLFNYKIALTADFTRLPVYLSTRLPAYLPLCVKHIFSPLTTDHSPLSNFVPFCLNIFCFFCTFCGNYTPRFSSFLYPIPDTRHPIPETRNPRPETRDPIPETRNPRPETRDPKPYTRDPIPETRDPALFVPSILYRHVFPTYPH